MTFKACKECVPPKRHVGCHSTCPDYIADAEQNRAEKNALRASLAESYEIDNKRKCIDKLNRKYKNRRRSRH